MNLTKVLTNWQPSKLDKETINKEFIIEVQKCLEFTHKGLEIRSPHENIELYNSEHEWKHSQSRVPRDLDSNYKMTFAIDFHKDGSQVSIVWSNIIPTEVKLSDETLLKCKDGDIILIYKDLHKVPPIISTERWFARLNDVQIEEVGNA